jgi:hypothetical protein
LNDTVMSWSKRLSRLLYGRASALRPDERHRVILNWNARATQQVAAWAAENKTVRIDIRVVTSEPVVLPAQVSASAVQLIDADPKTRAALDAARVSDAECVLICSAWCKLDPSDRRKLVDSELADSYTIRAIQTIRALNGNAKRVVPIVAEIRLERNRREAEAEGAPRIEVVGPEPGGASAVNGHTVPAPAPLSSPSGAAAEASH